MSEVDLTEMLSAISAEGDQLSRVSKLVAYAERAMLGLPVEGPRESVRRRKDQGGEHE